MRAQIARLNPEDVAGYERVLDYADGVYQEGYRKLGSVAFLDFASMVRAAPALAKHQAWRSVYSVVSSYVKNEKLRQALSFHTLPSNTVAEGMADSLLYNMLFASRNSLCSSRLRTRPTASPSTNCKRN